MGALITRLTNLLSGKDARRQSGRVAGFYHVDRVVRAATAMLLIIAVITKAMSGSHEYGRSPLILLAFESILACWLLLGYRARAAMAVAAATFLVFAAGAWLKSPFGSCGCFGAIAIAPRHAAIADLTMATGLVAVASQLRRWVVFGGAAIGLLAVAGFGAAALAGAASQGHRPITAGERVPDLLELSEVVDGSRLSLIVIYDPSCDLCQKAVPAFVDFARDTGQQLPVILVSTAPGADLGPPDPDLRRLSRPAASTLVRTTPTVFATEAGRVIFVRDGADAVDPYEVLANLTEAQR